MSEWTENFENDIKVQIEDMKRLDAGYINVRLLNNTAKKIDRFSDNCQICQNYKKDYNQLLPGLVKRIENSKDRNIYEKKLVEVVQHLEHDHGIKAKNYYTSLFTFLGLITGVFLAVVPTYFVRKDYVLMALLYGAFSGLILGRVIGMIKDKRIKQAGLSL